MPRGRQSNGRSTIVQQPDGWHGFVSMGTNPYTGKPVRKHVRGRTKAEVSRKVTALEKQRDTTLPGATDTGTINTLLDYWLDYVGSECRNGNLRPATRTFYTDMTDSYLRRLFGHIPVARLTPEIIETGYATLLHEGKSHSTVAGAHRALRRCLNFNVKRRKIPANPALLASAPAPQKAPLEPLNLQEALRVLETARTARNGAIVFVRLLQGLRQGESLGLTWDDINFTTGEITVRRTLRRRSWTHGCAASRPGSPIRPDHTPAKCPKRHRDPLVGAPKSGAGTRVVSLADEVLAALKAHKALQAAERLAAGSMWRTDNPDGAEWVFATHFGTHIDPRNDYRYWQQLLQDAGVRRVRVHDARHTAASLFMLAEVDRKVVIEQFGWTSTALLDRYQHVLPGMGGNAARRLNALLEEEKGTA